jgi:DNA ligase (NAD+)
MSEHENRIRFLESEIRRHRELYYNRTPAISDAEFDALVDELERLAPESPVLAEVGAPVVAEATGLPTKRHRIPMGSLEKIASDRLRAWAEKTGPLFLVQEKYDGISLEIEYANGEMGDAITRGDGLVGEVVTHNAVHFKNVRRKLPRRFSGSVRAEVILRLSEFQRHFAGKDFANPRNTVSGTVRKKHGDRSLNRHFELFFYDVVDDEREFATEREKMEFLSHELGLELAVSYFDQTVDGILAIYEEYQGKEGAPGKRYALDYEIDGLVVRANSIALQKELGSRQNRPRYAMAYKFPSAGEVTTLLAVDWSLGIGSRITPIARLEPVEIGGVTVSNAQLHNADAIQALGIRLGDRVLVERRGDVIPQVMRVVESRGGELPQPPESCPACGARVARDGKIVFCPNPACPEKTYGNLFRWIGELEIDSLGEKWVRVLIEAGLLRDPVDLYALTVEKLVPLERMGETLAAKIVRNIEETRHPPLDRFLAALNIAGFSRQRAQMLIDEGFATLDKILALNAADVARVKGFAEVTAEMVVEGLAARRSLIERLRAAGVEPQAGQPAPRALAAGSGPLAGKSVCFTGGVRRLDPKTGKRYSRKDLQELVVRHGGRVLDNVSSGLDYLVMADPSSTSSKAKKARELGTAVLSEEEFFEMLETTIRHGVAGGTPIAPRASREAEEEVG